MNANAERTWWQRNTKWIVLAAIFAGLLMLAAFVAGIVFVVVAATRSSEVYQTAVAQAKASSEVTALLGQPVEPGLFVSGNIQIENRKGEADLSIPLSGPKGKAVLSVIAHRRAGVWHYESMQVEAAGATRIDLVPPDGRESPEGDAE